MELIGKIGTIALGSVTVAGASAYYSYSTSIQEKAKEDNKKTDIPKRKRVIVEWKQAKDKEGYKTCLSKGKSKTVCGWLYNGL